MHEVMFLYEYSSNIYNRQHLRCPSRHKVGKIHGTVWERKLGIWKVWRGMEGKEWWMGENNERNRNIDQ